MLVDLPPEILLQILSHITTASALQDISVTCRTLHTLVEGEGWKTFVLKRFPSFQVPPLWKDAARALTTLSRNWDRKAFLARDFEPFQTRIYTLPQGVSEVLKGKWKRPHGQTMGYQPVIDSYEAWTNDCWDSRKEVVAWGAGAKLMMKTTRRGKDVVRAWEGASDEERELDYDAGRNKIDWISYHDPRVHMDGRDDITSLNIIKPQQSSTDGSPALEEIVAGRASGELSLLQLGKGVKQCKIRQFDTQRALVRSADVTSDRSDLLAACLGDARAVLYQIHGLEEVATPISEVSCVSKTEHRCRTWSSRFISPHRLAIGRGVSKTLVHIYDVQSTGLSEEPIRSFGSGRGAKTTQTSAYPIVGIPESTTSTETTGNAFFSGGYDGIIRLHDMRSPSDCEISISDPTDDSAIFSLLMVGRERIVAGGAVNALLKIFDVRMPGGRVYSYLDANQNLTNSNGASVVLNKAESDQAQISGWNLFTTPRVSSNKPYRRQEGGPIYSLSRPSPSSTSLYVGRENSVTHLNFTSVLDRHPDSVYRNSLYKGPNGDIDIQKTWDPTYNDRVLRLSMYNQTTSGDVRLKVQRDVQRASKPHGTIAGYDERWVGV